MSPRFAIPNLPADRPKVPLVRALIQEYYRKPGNEVTGGNLHIVIDDGNMDSFNVEWALRYCEQAGDEDGAGIAKLLLKMTRTQRRKVYSTRRINTSPDPSTRP